MDSTANGICKTCNTGYILPYGGHMAVWSEDHLGLVSRRLNTIYDKRGLKKVFDQIKGGEKSNMAEKDIIGCVELGSAQG